RARRRLRPAGYPAAESPVRNRVAEERNGRPDRDKAEVARRQQPREDEAAPEANQEIHESRRRQEEDPGGGPPANLGTAQLGGLHASYVCGSPDPHRKVSVG